MTATHNEDSNMTVDSTRGNLLTDVQTTSTDIDMPSTNNQMALNDHTHHDIMSILQRPVRLGTYTWSTANEPIPVTLDVSDYQNDTQNYIQEWNFPQDIFTNSPNVVDKLSRYQYFRSRVEIEIKWNAQQFLQGALLLVYNPYLSEVDKFRRVGTRFMASQTTCPNQIITLQQGDSFKMICPYANIYDLFDLANSNNQFGTVFLYAMSPLFSAAGSETISFTAFARFVDPEFCVPTHVDTMASFKDEHQLKRLAKRGKLFAQSDVQPVAAKDTGESMAIGPISKVATGVSMISDVVSSVPVIGKIASQVAWVSRAIGKTAASFGWSKPVSIETPRPMVVKPNHTMIHTEGHDNATSLALLQDNGIDSSSFIPSDVDEMALSHIVSRPSYFHAISLTLDTFKAGSLLTSFEVSPLSQYQYNNIEDSQTLFLGGMAYVSQAFATLWRGTIIYDFLVVKTNWHQGRFVVVFLPETNMADVPTELGDLNNTNYNTVCDLGNAEDGSARTRYSFTVPYISNTAWRETYKSNGNATNPGPDATTLDTKTGCVAVYALTDLKAPETVAPRIDLYVAHRGGDDFQLARPQLNLAPGFQSLYAQNDVGPFTLPMDENLLVPQHSSQDVTAQTTGEYFKSLRALIKRFGRLANLSQASDYVGLRTRLFSENPDTGYRVNSRANFNDRTLPTPWYMASFLYRFYAGSSMTKIIPPTSSASAFAYLRYGEDTESQTVLPESDEIGKPTFQQLQNISNAFEIRTPYYRGIRADVVNSTQTPVLGDVRTCVKVVDSTDSAIITEPSRLYEAAGDDFSFFFLVGVPPMCDIRNVRLPVSFPTGTTVQVDLSTYTGVDVVQEPYPAGLAVRSPTFTPALDEGPEDVYGPITSSTRVPFTIVYTDGTTEEVELTSCSVANLFNNTPTLYIPTNVDKTVDVATTVTQNTGVQTTFEIVTTYPTT